LLILKYLRAYQERFDIPDSNPFGSVAVNLATYAIPTCLSRTPYRMPGENAWPLIPECSN